LLIGFPFLVCGLHDRNRRSLIAPTVREGLASPSLPLAAGKIARNLRAGAQVSLPILGASNRSPLAQGRVIKVAKCCPTDNRNPMGMPAAVTDRDKTRVSRETP
jgi:hypothetical protein